MTPDIVYDQLIGAGCARKLVFSWGGNPGVGSLHRFRDAVEHGWPQPLEIEEHSHAGMANRYVAGASGLPFAVMRGYSGTDLPEHTRRSADHLPVHRRGADRGAGARTSTSRSSTPSRPTARATCSCGAYRACRRRRCSPPSARWSPSRRSSTSSSRGPAASCSRAGSSTRVAEVPGGAQPSYAQGYYERDNDFYRAWDDDQPRPRAFSAWMDEHVLGVRVRSRLRRADEMMRIAAAARAARRRPRASSASACPAPPRTSPAARTPPTWCWSTSPARSAPSRRGCRSRSATAILAETADAVVSVPEIFNYWSARPDRRRLPRRRPDRPLRQHQHDGDRDDYDHPKVRLPGAGGAPEIAAGCGEVIVIVRQSHARVRREGRLHHLRRLRRRPGRS